VTTVPAHGGRTDAYRIFFPLGILMGLAGVSIWPLYYFGVTSGYSGRAHAHIQINGFLYCFIAGFLLTAIPRFTGTTAPARSAQWTLAALLVAASVAFELQYFGVGHAFFLAAHATLILLAARRFLRRQHPPPETFALVGVGILSGAFGASIGALVSWNVIPPGLDLLGRRLLTEGMVLMLVLGVGGFLGPRLMGFAALPELQSITRLSAEREGRKGLFLLRYRSHLYLAAGIALLLSLVLEYGFGIGMMAFVRAALASGIILGTVEPWHAPAVRTTLAWCVWAANIFLLVGVWLVAIAPAYRVDFLHVVFMGGFTLMILAVATRVTLSHGGHALALEKRSWPLRIGITTGVIAIFARTGAPFAPFSFFEHLALAALLWMAGIGLWGWYVFRLIRPASRT
jgi:uncharacterized protein involved in response to NO